jgi:hypothetical protein
LIPGATIQNGTIELLVVNDLKLGDREGGVALCVGVGTEAYFTNFRLTQ